MDEAHPDTIASRYLDGSYSEVTIALLLCANVGFTDYREEGWHFNYGNQFWAKLNGTDTIYGAVYKGSDAIYIADELSKYGLPRC